MREGNIMSEQINYFDKFLVEKFQHIDESVKHIDDKVNESINRMDQSIDRMDQKIDESINKAVNDLKGQFADFRKEVKEENEVTRSDNKSTRHWILGSAITFFVGFIVAAIAIFFGFAQLQTSWIQMVISFVGKTIVK